MDVQSNATSGLTDHRAALQCIIDPLDAIIFHAYQEAARHLRVRRPGVEQRRRGVGEVAFRHEVIRFEDAVDIGAVDTDGDTHDHVLRAFGDTTADAKEVGTLECFEAEAVMYVS